MSDKEDLEKEEKEILESYERDEWHSVSTNKERKRYSEYALHSLRKTKKINLRLSERDYFAIKKIAEEEGIPYQTLISSLVHKYVQKKLKIK
ncbi:MAG: antitoxin [Nitrospirae bacterium]|nr:MAG: antitoxin [Nitrospirota bacterium]